MKTISFNKQYSNWTPEIRGAVLSMFSLFIIVVYAFVFFVSQSSYLSFNNDGKEQIAGNVLGVSDRQDSVKIKLNSIEEGISLFSLSSLITTSPVFADLTLKSVQVEIFDAYCVDIVRCSVELEDNNIYISLKGLIIPANGKYDIAFIEFNYEDSGALILDNGLAEDSYIMEQGSNTNLIENAYFSFQLGAN
jgi:hypothetical protein